MGIRVSDLVVLSVVGVGVEVLSEFIPSVADEVAVLVGVSALSGVVVPEKVAMLSRKEVAVGVLVVSLANPLSGASGSSGMRVLTEVEAPSGVGILPVVSALSCTADAVEGLVLGSVPGAVISS